MVGKYRLIIGCVCIAVNVIFLTNTNISKFWIKLGSVTFCQGYVNINYFCMSIKDKYGVSFSHDKKVLEYCPGYFSGEYLIPNSVKRISDSAFCGCENLKSIIIPNSVTRISKK